MQNTIMDISLAQLERSPLNMRKTDQLADIPQLAADILAKGILENLVVHALEGKREKYGVVAGGRRLAALKFLAKQKKIAKGFPVPCLIKNDADPLQLVEISLSENLQRLDPHPADQFEAFAALIQEGKTAADVSARFGVTETFVQQRLKLALVSPRLLAQYREGAMTLEQLMAFTVSSDHQEQDQLWFESPYEDMPAHFIRRQLTAAQVDASDRRAIFIGVKAYEAAGGVVLRDLFDQAHEGYFQDSQLLDRLVAEKLAIVAESIRAEGWSWVEVRARESFIRTPQFGRIGPSQVALSAEEEEHLSKLADRYDELVSSLEEDDDESVSHELDRVDDEIKGLNAKREVWRDEDKARAGVIVSLDGHGEVHLTTGLIRLHLSDEDDSQVVTPPQEKPSRSGYPESVLVDLSAHRTAALRASLAEQPANAFSVMLYALVQQVFYSRRVHGVEIGINPISLDRSSETVASSKATQLLTERHDDWWERMTKVPSLMEWLHSLDDVERHSLLAYCVAMSINALHGRSKTGPILDDDTDLARLVSLDMSQWWSPTESFFVRLTKHDIIEAVSEGGPPGSINKLGDLKRHELARKAEVVLTGSGWLPKPWRPEEQVASAAE